MRISVHVRRLHLRICLHRLKHTLLLVLGKIDVIWVDLNWIRLILIRHLRVAEVIGPISTCNAMLLGGGISRRGSGGSVHK